MQNYTLAPYLQLKDKWYEKNSNWLFSTTLFKRINDIFRILFINLEEILASDAKQKCEPIQMAIWWMTIASSMPPALRNMLPSNAIHLCLLLSGIWDSFWCTVWDICGTTPEFYCSGGEVSYSGDMFDPPLAQHLLELLPHEFLAVVWQNLPWGGYSYQYLWQCSYSLLWGLVFDENYEWVLWV